MGIMVYSSLSVMQDLDHQPYVFQLEFELSALVLNSRIPIVSIVAPFCEVYLLGSLM